MIITRTTYRHDGRIEYNQWTTSGSIRDNKQYILNLYEDVLKEKRARLEKPLRTRFTNYNRVAIFYLKKGSDKQRVVWEILGGA